MAACVHSAANGVHATGLGCRTAYIEYINRSRSTPLDPLCFDKNKNYYTSLALVDACIPFEERESFPRATGAPAEYMDEVSKKWGKLFDE